MAELAFNQQLTVVGFLMMLGFIVILYWMKSGEDEEKDQ